MQEKNVLICDIGGTNVRFGIYKENQQGLVSFDGKYKCAEFSSFEEVVQRYFTEHKPSSYPQLCVIGAAGDIDERTGKIVATNTPWKADIQKLKQTFPFIKKAQLVNDFALQGWALADMTEDQYTPLFNSKPDINLSCGKVVVIGPGTGLGTCVIMPNDQKGQNVYTSEAGHSTIPLVSFEINRDEALNQKVLDVITSHYKAKGQRAITEHLVSGTGIVNIYHALKDGYIPTERAERMPSEKIEHLAQAGDENALKTFDIFNAYLGAHAGTMVATTKTETIFFCGGVMASPWIRNYLQETPHFKTQFIPRSGLTEAMKKVHIYASEYRDMSTLGAVVYAKNMIAEKKGEEKKTQADKDMLHLLHYMQSFIEANCPQVQQEMKKIVLAVRKMQKDNSKERE